MGCLKYLSLVIRFSCYPHLIRIIIMHISFFCLLSSSNAFASRQHLVPLNSSNLFFRNGNDGESVLAGEFKRVMSAIRVQRSSGNYSNEKDHRPSSHDKGTNSKKDLFNNIDGSYTIDEFNKRHSYLLMAQQEAKCLQEFGKLEPAISFDFPKDLFRPFVCLEGSQSFSACEECIQMIRNISTSGVNRRTDKTGGTEKFSNATFVTNVFCESIKPPLSKTRATMKPTLTTSLQRHKKAANNRHFVYLKSLFSDGGDGTVAKRAVPLVFVIEQREHFSNASGPKSDGSGRWTAWRTLGKSPYGFDKIPVAYRQQTYQWRVTAVGIHGPLAVSTVKSFDSLDGYMEPGPPTRVFVLENKPKESTVDVLIGWDPPQERACFYKIVLETRNEEETVRTLRIKREPLGVHKVWFRRLKFGSTYEVRVTSRSAEWHDNESTHASLSFATPACLDAHQFRFDKCVPPPPRNLSFSVQAAGSSKVIDASVNPSTSLKRHFTANLTWKPPVHATVTNSIEKYNVHIQPLPWNVRKSSNKYSKHQESRSELMIDPQYLLTPRWLQLPGNVTHVRVDNLDEAAEYTVLVSAVSSKGSSPAATLTIKAQPDVGSLKTSVSFWVYPWGILLTVLVVASGCHAVKRIGRSKQVKAARDSYFKDIDQRDTFTVEWCVVSSTEDPNSTWAVLEENSVPKDKWHVGFQDLTIGDIIGQGAFGIVRKAEIRSDKYLELLKRHKTKTLDTHFEMCGAELSNNVTVMKPVAVKMLKAAATKADREDLMKELMTMQSLGMHPQIVTLLGVSTSPKSMCLVLEYCPGGDLLSFLRKFQENYLSMLRPTETETFHCKNQDETAGCESISEKDVLSYARQIALGMAYLERNHIIHRDLACRNILVMEDHKRIKISDFGLSRDIYTRNVYRQKTEGKVPFKWMAPESITSRIFTSKSDVWSFGIVVWELVTLGAVPYPALENQELLNMLRTGYRMERPDNCSEELYALMRKCWRIVPVDRPNFAELIMYLEAMMETEPELYLTLEQ